MTTRAYSRCNSGHWFQGSCCPLDGWSSQASEELAQACQRLRETDRPISIATLLEAGVSPASLSRIIVIEFGSVTSCFDAIAPQGYVVDGNYSPIDELEDAFL